jgi:hypothetical protein
MKNPTSLEQPVAGLTPAEWSYLSVNLFSKKYPTFTLGSLRSLVFNEHSNGLADFGAIVRIGTRVLISEPKFFAWVSSQSSNNHK